VLDRVGTLPTLFIFYSFFFSYSFFFIFITFGLLFYFFMFSALFFLVFTDFLLWSWSQVYFFQYLGWYSFVEYGTSFCTAIDWLPSWYRTYLIYLSMSFPISAFPAAYVYPQIKAWAVSSTLSTFFFDDPNVWIASKSHDFAAFFLRLFFGSLLSLFWIPTFSFLGPYFLKTFMNTVGTVKESSQITRAGHFIVN